MEFELPRGYLENVRGMVHEYLKAVRHAIEISPLEHIDAAVDGVINQMKHDVAVQMAHMERAGLRHARYHVDDIIMTLLFYQLENILAAKDERKKFLPSRTP